MSGPTGLSGNEHGSTSYYNSIKSEFEGTSKSILDKMGCWNVTDRLACMRETVPMLLQPESKRLAADAPWWHTVYYVMSMTT
jgi:hypothetical protein